jgi:hypothetical protein
MLRYFLNKVAATCMTAAAAAKVERLTLQVLFHGCWFLTLKGGASVHTARLHVLFICHLPPCLHPARASPAKFCLQEALQDCRYLMLSQSAAGKALALLACGSLAGLQ